jgi:hypothetical protein
VLSQRHTDNRQPSQARVFTSARRYRSYSKDPRLSKVRGSWFLEATDFCHPQARQIHRCIFAPVTSVNTHYYSVLTTPFCKIYI